MNAAQTVQALAEITDEGKFELLAKAILRNAPQGYPSLAHPGVNVAGKTVKSPVDGICFEKGADPPHMIVVHHTTTARDDLEKKWLHAPSTVKPRNGPRPTAPAGDLIKAGDLAAEERKRIPNLRTTLVLTTNQEPGEQLIRDVQAAGRDRGLEIDLWSRSRLSDFLDNQPTGQWLRKEFLSIDQELLSVELLQALSKRSLEDNVPPWDNPKAWISRGLDRTLATDVRHGVTFLLGASGVGKSVACYRKLRSHVEKGGYGLVLSHATVDSAITLDQAIASTLRLLHPSLSVLGESALSLCTQGRPLLLLVEDINRSGKARLLAEKLARWSRTPEGDEKVVSANWQLICPLWPEVFASMGEQARKHIEPLLLRADTFSAAEGQAAVLVRAQLHKISISALVADEVSTALGHDPLLIALHDLRTTPEPHRIIGYFVEGALSRAAGADSDHVASDYRQALRRLAAGMLENRQIELIWQRISEWSSLQSGARPLLIRLARQGELLRLTGSSNNQRLEFRHDRVRDWLLADAASELERMQLLTDAIVTEPYFAEVMGTVLVVGGPRPAFLQRVASLNPLALFHALRLLGNATTPQHADIALAINAWLDDPATHDRSNLQVRFEAQAMLAQTDSHLVPMMVKKFKDRDLTGTLARLRNGDLAGGIELCLVISPGIDSSERDLQLEHAKLHHGVALTEALERLLTHQELNNRSKMGALRLAGHIADASLAPALEGCWLRDNHRLDSLADHLWAFAQCCGDDPNRYLGPVCDAWAVLPDEAGKGEYLSPRAALASEDVRWAFHRCPPLSAISYFVQRGAEMDLKSPITYMLHGVDEPRAIGFVVQQLAAVAQRMEGSRGLNWFLHSAPDDWRKRQESGKPMSSESRHFLRGLWQNSFNDRYLRSQAFSLWAATCFVDDLAVLRAVTPSDELADHILRERLTRGDQEAISLVIGRLAADDTGTWWQYMRQVWSPEVTRVLEDSLNKRDASDNGSRVGNSVPDWLAYELIMRLPAEEAERLLLKHWTHLRSSAYLVLTALYVCTPPLVDAARAALDESPEPARLVNGLSRHFGINTRGHPGIMREAQVRVLAPYLHLVSSLDIWMLWQACNDRGWFTMRRELLDGRLQEPFLFDRWDRHHIMSELDKMIAEKRLWFPGHWIDRFLKIDVSWREILETLMNWLDERRSLEALRVLSLVIGHRGTREDLSALRVYAGMLEVEAREIISDTEFAVKRRSIR